MKKMRKDTLGPAELDALIRPIMKESPEWARAVAGLMNGDQRAFDSLVARGDIPISVAPVIARMAAGKSMKLDGRPRRHPPEVHVDVWMNVMRERHLGARAIDAEATAAKLTGLTPGQVAGIVEALVSCGLTLEAWRVQFSEILPDLEALRRH